MDPKRFDADPDPLFMLIRTFLARERKQFILYNLQLFFQILQNLSCEIFSVTMREKERGMMDPVWGMRGKGYRRGVKTEIRCGGGGVTQQGWGRRDERLSMKEEGKGGGNELGSDLDLDPYKILWIRIRQNDADPLDPDRAPM